MINNVYFINNIKLKYFKLNQKKYNQEEIFIMKILKIGIILLFISIMTILKYMKDIKDDNIKKSFNKYWNNLFHYFCNETVI